jgi:hypothetical protein
LKPIRGLPEQQKCRHSQTVAAYPAACGRQVRCGIRQSTPQEKITKLCGRNCHQFLGRRVPQESPALQPLGEQAHALAVMLQLDQVAAPTSEDEQMAAVRDSLQPLLDQERQPDWSISLSVIGSTKLHALRV